MNRVEFLGLELTFTTVSPSNVQNILCQTLEIFTVVREECYVIITNLTISLALITFGEQSMGWA